MIKIYMLYYCKKLLHIYMYLNMYKYHLYWVGKYIYNIISRNLIDMLRTNIEFHVIISEIV